MILPSLVVDPDPAGRASIAALLESEGWSVEQAATLEEARNVLKLNAPSLAVVEVNLPDGNGLDLVREIQPLPGTEAIMLSAEASPEAIRLGAAMYMTSHGWREGVPTLIALVQEAPPAVRPIALSAMREVADISIIRFPADPNDPAWAEAAGLLRTWWDQNSAKLKLRDEKD